MYSIQQDNIEQQKQAITAQDNIYSNNEDADTNVYKSTDLSEVHQPDPPFLEWCKKILKSFRTKKPRRRTERWLPQLNLTVNKEITIDFKRRQINFGIKFRKNSNTPVNLSNARFKARNIARGLIRTGSSISISGSTSSSRLSLFNPPNYIIDGQTVPSRNNLGTLVNSRATLLAQLLIDEGVPQSQINVGPPIYNSTATNPFAAVASITSNRVTRRVKRTTSNGGWSSVPAGAGKHQLIKKKVKTTTIDNR